MSDVLKYKADLVAFVCDLWVDVGGRVVRLGDILAPFQLDWLRSVAPSIMAVANGTKPPITRFWGELTKGSGKDLLIASMVLWLLVFSPRMLLIQIAAVDKEQAGGLKRSAREIVKETIWLAAFVQFQTWAILNERTGTQADFLASDIAGGAHGSRPDLLVLNELSHQEKWELPSTLMDNASKMADGVVIAAMNAGFTDSPCWAWRENARTSGHWHFTTYERPAPWITEAELSDVRRRNSIERVNRLFFGQWCRPGAGYITDAMIESTIRLNGPPQDINEKWWAIMGYDGSATKNDTSCVTVGGLRGSGRIQLIDCRVWTPPVGGRIDQAEIKSYILEMRRKIPKLWVRFEVYAAEGMAQELDPDIAKWRAEPGKSPHAHGKWCELIPVSDTSKREQASVLVDLFNSDKLDLFRHPRLLADIKKIRILDTPRGIKVDLPEDGNSHIDAAAAFLTAIVKGVAESNRKKRSEFFVTTGDTDPVHEPTPPAIFRGGSLSSFVRKATRGY
jgi:hypothetical protein